MIFNCITDLGYSLAIFLPQFYRSPISLFPAFYLQGGPCCKIIIMKSVLFPTDLAVQSLYPAHEICRQAGSGKCNIYVIHTLEMPTSIADLLFLQGKKPYNKLHPEFLEAMDMLRTKYAAVINLLSFEFVWGNSGSFLSNYMQGRDIQSIYLLKDYDYKPGLPQSVNCIPALRRCKLPVVYVQKVHKQQHGTFTTLLLKNNLSHVVEK